MICMSASAIVTMLKRLTAHIISNGSDKAEHGCHCSQQKVVGAKSEGLLWEL